MKRSLAMLLAVLLALSLCACSSGRVLSAEGQETAQKALQPLTFSSGPAALPLSLSSSHGTIHRENHSARVANADSLFDQFLRQHPNYSYGGYIDLDGDGVNEMVVSEMSFYPDWGFVTLCAINSQGNRVLSWKLYSSTGLQYEPLTRSVLVSAGGTGVLEYCLVHPEGDQLAVHRIGYNCTRPEWTTPYFYDYSDQISGGDEVVLTFHYGEAGSFEPDMTFLQRYAIDEIDWTTMSQYFITLPDLNLPSL